MIERSSIRSLSARPTHAGGTPTPSRITPFISSTVASSIDAGSSLARILMRVLSHRSPSMMSLPPRPSMTSLPSPPRIMLPSPHCMTAVSNKLKVLSVPRRPSIRSKFLRILSPPFRRNANSSAVASSPRRMSPKADPVSPSTVPKRSRTVWFDAGSGVSKATRSSMSASTPARLSRWVTQSNPSPPSKRSIPELSIMISSPDSACRSSAPRPPWRTSLPMIELDWITSALSPCSTSSPSFPSIQSSPEPPAAPLPSVPASMKSFPVPERVSLRSAPARI